MNELGKAGVAVGCQQQQQIRKVSQHDHHGLIDGPIAACFEENSKKDLALRGPKQ
jgi:hypothetical protein